MIIEQKIFALSASMVLFLTIIVLVRKRKLREEYSLLWVIISGTIFLLTAVDPLLYFIKDIFKAKAETSIIYMLGILFLLILGLHFSVVLSSLKNNVKELIQKLALMDNEIKELKDKLNR